MIFKRKSKRGNIYQENKLKPKRWKKLRFPNGTHRSNNYGK